ncbi:MAG TPA: hypothetical protein HPP56_10095 [Nitrospirae bacterium]|nr:hypothetical protein [Nitrospirota bacterium]
MKGEIEVSFLKYDETLTTGDSLFIKDNNPIKWANKGGEEAELLIIWK